MPARPDRLTLLAFLVAVVVLGVNPVGVRFSDRELAPFFGAALRFLAATATLFTLVSARGIALARGRVLAGAVVTPPGVCATYAMMRRVWASSFKSVTFLSKCIGP